MIDISNFFTKGYVLIHDPTMFEPLEQVLPSVKWTQDSKDINLNVPKPTRKLSKALAHTHNLLAETYVGKVFGDYHLGYGDIWNGYDTGATNWHSDLNEKPNAMFLMYFTEMTESTGGGLGYRRAMSKEETGMIYPKKYDIVFGSQQPSWEHRVTKLNIPTERIVANFGFIINGL